MKKIISVYIIFAFLLTSFAGCGKLKNSPVSELNQLNNSTLPETVSQSETSTPSAQVSQSLNIQNEDLNQDNALVPLNNSAVSNITQQSNTSSEINAKDLTKKESWKEWTCRQWKDNKWFWICGAVAVVSIGVSPYLFEVPEEVRESLDLPELDTSASSSVPQEISQSLIDFINRLHIKVFDSDV